MTLYKAENGLPVLTDVIDSVESVSVGVFVGSGACSETVENNGVAHFLEHMAFKGTESRSAHDIAREIEEVGGDLNAFTGRDMTAYTVRVLRENLPLAVEILGDILLNPTFDAEQMELERGVILQEMGMYEDQPSSKCFENLEELCYPDQPMGHRIIGTEDTVTDMTPDHLRAFVDSQYSISNMVVSAAGSFDPKEFVGLCSKHLGGLRDFQVQAPPIPVFHSGKMHETRQTEQANISMAWEGFSVSNPLAYPARVWGMIHGSGMSSRLWQEIREKRGLVYSVGGSHCAETDSGCLYVHAGTDPKDVKAVLDLIHQELAKTDITEKEVSKAKTLLNAGIRMAQESTTYRANGPAFDWFQFGTPVPLQEKLELIDAVTLDQVLEAQAQILGPGKYAVSVLGPNEFDWL